MMSRLHVASWGLLMGVAGQTALYAALTPHVPFWLFFLALSPPWLTVYTISFCRQAPFGPRRFRHCLLFAMCWYAVATVVAETMHILIHPAPYGHFPTFVARLLTYSGALTYIVFIRACLLLRRIEIGEGQQ
jgi:hypothetical protein